MLCQSHKDTALPNVVIRCSEHDGNPLYLLWFRTSKLPSNWQGKEANKIEVGYRFDRGSRIVSDKWFGAADETWFDSVTVDMSQINGFLDGIESAGIVSFRISVYGPVDTDEEQISIPEQITEEIAVNGTKEAVADLEERCTEYFDGG